MKEFKIHSLQLQYYLLFQNFVWTEFDPLKDYKMDLNDLSTLNNYPSYLNNVNDFGAFIAWEFSMEPYTRALFGLFYWPIYIEHIDKDAYGQELCTMMWYVAGHSFEKCVQDKNLNLM